MLRHKRHANFSDVVDQIHTLLLRSVLEIISWVKVLEDVFIFLFFTLFGFFFLANHHHPNIWHKSALQT